MQASPNTELVVGIGATVLMGMGAVTLLRWLGGHVRRASVAARRSMRAVDARMRELGNQIAVRVRSYAFARERRARKDRQGLEAALVQTVQNLSELVSDQQRRIDELLEHLRKR